MLIPPEKKNPTRITRVFQNESWIMRGLEEHIPDIKYVYTLLSSKIVNFIRNRSWN
jgi:hypothetical protein